MSEILKKLPEWYYLVAFLLFLIAIVFIAVKGKLIVMWGKKKIGIGRSPNSPSKKGTGSGESTVKPLPKRSCGDCVLILISEREKYELSIGKMYNRTLRDQMNYAEQKLLDIQGILDKCFDSKYDIVENPGSYEVQYKLFYGLVSTALVKVKDEIRRSFKENGFLDMDDKEFTDYVKERLNNLIQMLNRSLKTIYPSTKDGLSIGIEDILGGINMHMSDLQDIIREMYIRAKAVIVETSDKTHDLEEKFSVWIDKFIN